MVRIRIATSGCGSKLQAHEQANDVSRIKHVYSYKGVAVASSVATEGEEKVGSLRRERQLGVSRGQEVVANAPPPEEEESAASIPEDASRWKWGGDGPARTRVRARLTRSGPFIKTLQDDV